MRRKIKKKSFFDKFSYSTRNTNIFLAVVFLLLLSGLTIGYSILTNVLSIKGDVAIRPFKDIRITSVTGPEMTNGAYENYNFKYSHDLLVVNGVLPNTNSTLTYTITITNNGTIDMDLIDIINTCNNSDIYYELNGINLGDTIKAKTSVTLTLTLKTNVGSNDSFNSQLQFIFEESYVDITPPIITFNPIANDEWSKDDYIVNIKATDDIAVTNFMYCVTTSNSCTPNIVIANNSDIDVTVNNSSETNTICSKASDSSKYGPNSITVCSNKDNKYYKLDKIAPTINPTLSGTLGNNGWYKSDVLINPNGIDTLSQYYGHKYQISTDNGVNYSTLSDYTNDNIIVNNECVDNKVKITGYDNAINNSSTYTSDTIKIDKTAPVITVDGHTSDYSVDYEITQEQINQKYENGTLVYYDPVKGEVCDESEYVKSNSLNENKTGCMKWYIFNDEKENKTVDMILDHNTTYNKEWISAADYTTANTDGTSCSYISCNDEGPITTLNQLQIDTAGWNDSLIRNDSYTDPLKGYTIDYTGYKARLIEANEVADIVGATEALKWNSGLPYGTTVGSRSSWFYFDGTGTTYTGWQTQVTNNTNKSNYAWLFDYTYNCASYGCNISVDYKSGQGYWTSSASAYDSGSAWYVHFGGSLALNYVHYTYYGVRPVITIDKKELVKIDLPTEVTTDNCGEEVNVITSGLINTKVPGKYPIKYTATDQAGNSSSLTVTINIKDTTPPVINVAGNTEDFTLNGLAIAEENNYQIPEAIVTDDSNLKVEVVTTGNIDFNNEGSYPITYKATDASGNTSTLVMTMNIVKNGNIDYKGQVYPAIILGDGYYKLQTWGAQGGYRANQDYAGKGGYSEGTIYLKAGTILYVYVGGSGTTGATNGGFNGGGLRNTYNGGGGASDIRIDKDSLYARIMVAGGGGSDGRNSSSGRGGYGGGEIGEATSNISGAYGSGGYAGTQTGVSNSSYQTSKQSTSTTSQADAYAGFGFGGNGVSINNGYGGAGGGGWYGGAGIYPDSADDDRGGAGGSGYVYNEETASNYPKGCLLNENHYLMYSKTIGGNESFESPTGTTETGHTGDGYAKISYIGKIITTVSFNTKNGTLGNTYYSNLTRNAVISNDNGLKAIKYCLTNTTSCTSVTDYNITEGTTKVTLPVEFDTNALDQRLCVTVTDMSGKETITCDKPFKVDKTEPTSGIIVNVTGTQTTLTAEFTDNESGIWKYQYYYGTSMDNINTTMCSETLTNTCTKAVPDGNYYYKIIGYNNAGLSKEITYTLKTKATFETTNSTLGNTYYSKLERTANITNPDGLKQIDYCLTTSNTCSSTTNYNITEGSTTVTIPINFTASKDNQRVCLVTTDMSNKQTTICDNETFKVDTTEPNPKILVRGAGTLVTVTPKFTDSESGMWKYQYYYGTNENDVNNIMCGETTETSCMLKLTEGTYYFKVVGYNNAGISKEITEAIELPIWSDGTLVYYNPVDNVICTESDYVANNSKNEYKGQSGSAGCMKWYVFGDEKSKTTVDMILDHNTTYKKEWITGTDYTTANTDGTSCSYISCNDEGPITTLNQLQIDTAGWNDSLIRNDSYTDPLKGYTIDYTGYKARLIEANEIAKITGADKALQWNSGLPYGTTVGSKSAYFYFDGTGTTYTGWQTKVANSTNKSSYAWLFDYTLSCTSYGCNTADSGTSGYWTSSASALLSYSAWSVYSYGHLNYNYVDDTRHGVRPVITIPKSLLTQ